MLMRWGRRWLRLRKRLLYTMHFLTIYLPLVWDYDRLHHRRFFGGVVFTFFTKNLDVDTLHDAIRWNEEVK